MVIKHQVNLSVITGLWYYLEGNDHPCLTLIGSPNFGYRSVHRDIEAQIAIVTENDELQTQLQQVSVTHTGVSLCKGLFVCIVSYIIIQLTGSYYIISKPFESPAVYPIIYG